MKTKAKSKSMWTPTKSKKGNPKDQDGDAWCKEVRDGGQMKECIRIFRAETGYSHPCNKKFEKMD